MSVLPLIDASAATATGAALVPAGPAVGAREASEVVDALRRAAEASVAPVAQVSGLGDHAGDPMTVVDRATWLRANVEMALTMLTKGARQPLPTPRHVGEQVAARANGAQLGAVLAALATRILGQYLPFAAQPRLLLVAPNVVKVERQLGVAPDDFRLWVCLHEQTHRLQFARAPWLRQHLLDEVGLLLGDGATGPTDAPRRGRPHSLVEVVTTPGQQRVLERVGAAMSLLEGYADDMMDRVGPEVVPSVHHIRSRFEQHRNRGGWTKALNAALGMDLKLAQYRDGARFCRAVIERVGVDGLNVVYDAPAHLPGADEISDPARWLARVHG